MITDGLLRRKHHLPHWQLGGHTYFVTFRSTIGPLPDEAFPILKDTLLHDHQQLYRLYFAVMMPDHVHLLIQPLEKRAGEWHDLSRTMKRIKGISARRINVLLRRSGKLWQEESFDRIIRDEEEFIEKWNYIRNNPQKAGLAGDPADYPFYIEP